MRLKKCCTIPKINQLLCGRIFSLWVTHPSLPFLKISLIPFFKLPASWLCIWNTVKLATFVWFLSFSFNVGIGSIIWQKKSANPHIPLRLPPPIPPSPSVSLAGFPLFFCLAVGETKGTKEREETVSSSSTVVSGGVGLSIESWTGRADWSYEN